MIQQASVETFSETFRRRIFSKQLGLLPLFSALALLLMGFLFAQLDDSLGGAETVSILHVSSLSHSIDLLATQTSGQLAWFMQAMILYPETQRLAQEELGEKI